MAADERYVRHDGASTARLEAVRRAWWSLADGGPPYSRAEGDFARVSLPTATATCSATCSSRPACRSLIEVGLAYGSSALAVAEALLVQGHREPRTRTSSTCSRTSLGRRRVGRPRRRRAGNPCARRARPVAACAPGLPPRRWFHRRRRLRRRQPHLPQRVRRPLPSSGSSCVRGGWSSCDDCDSAPVATAVGYFQANTGWVPVAIGAATRLRAFRLPDPRVEPGFHEFKPFGP